MTIAESVGRNIVVLRPDGRLTSETAHLFSEAVAKWLGAGWKKLVVDLERVNAIDSTGLSVLVEAYKSADSCDARVALAQVFGKNRELLRVTRLLTVFDVYPTTADAERGLTWPVASMMT